MDYKKYQNARNASWELLIDLGIKELPVKITAVLKELGIPLYRYRENQTFIKNNELNALADISDGFTVLKDNRYYIFYDETENPRRIRFTLAHELGHIICNHLFGRAESGIFLTTRNKEPMHNDNPEEKQANVFASRLLAPACVLHELELFTAEGIAELCQISKQSATFRLERLLVLEQRHQDYLKTKGYGCFYLNPLEREVYSLFEEYIDNMKL